MATTENDGPVSLEIKRENPQIPADELHISTIIPNISFHSSYTCSSSGDDTRPSSYQVHHAVAVDGHILLRDHLDRLLRHETPEESGCSRQVCRW